MAALNTFWRSHFGLARRVLPDTPHSATVNTTVYTDSLIVPEGSLLLTPPAGTITRFDQNGLQQGTAVVLFTHAFQLYVPATDNLPCRALIRLKWEILAASGVDVTGRWSATAKRSGETITNAKVAYSPARACDAAPATVYDELLVVDIPKTAFTEGGTLDFYLAFAIVATAAPAITLGVGLHVDPSVPGNELVFEFLVGSP